MTAVTQVREQLLASNAKKSPDCRVANLRRAFFRERFQSQAGYVAGAAVGKIKLDEVKPSSRVNPFIRFDQAKKLYRLAVEAKDLAKGYGAEPLFKNLNMMIAVGERVAVIGPNGIGKSTLLKPWSAI